MALAVVGIGLLAQEWRREISDLLFALGWEAELTGTRPPAHSPTFDVLDQLAGAARTGWRGIEGGDFAVAATALAVIAPG